jgi:putative transposase
MKKEDAFSEEFLKQFKNGEELYAFLGQLQKRGVEAILEGEMDNPWAMRNIGNPTGKTSEMGIARKNFATSMERLKSKYLETEKAYLSRFLFPSGRTLPMA